MLLDILRINTIDLANKKVRLISQYTYSNSYYLYLLSTTKGSLTVFKVSSLNCVYVQSKYPRFSLKVSY